MRKLIVSILFYCFIQNINAQSYSYVSFPDSNVIWHVVGYVSAMGGIAAEYQSDFYYNGDTLLDNISYHKFFWKRDYYGEKYLFGFIRNDDQKRTYFKYNTAIYNDSLEHLLYDFSLKAGDIIIDSVRNKYDSTYNVYTNRIDSVEQIYINGQLRNKAYLSINSYSRTTWVEGVGDLNFPLRIYNQMNDFFFDLYNPTLCRFIHNDTVVYYNTFYMCDYFNGIKPMDIESYSVYPNPFTDHIELNTSTKINGLTFVLCDFLGREVVTEIGGQATTLDTHALCAGIYFLLVKENGNTKCVRKLIKYTP